MRILLINPPIYDFAAFNLWARPIGILKIISILKKLKIDFEFFDFLDISILTIDEKKKFKIKIKSNGTYNYPKVEVEKPSIFPKINRKFSRYGLPKEKFLNFLEKDSKFDFAIITSVMTYWYLGIIEVIEFLRKINPEIKIIVGGIYVNLCKEHALNRLKADYIVSSIPEVFKILNIDIKKFNFFPLPLELYKENPFAPLYTSFGCPFNCAYCANKFLNPPYTSRDHDKIIDELIFYKNLGIKRIAFYDEALLINKKTHFIPLMNKIISKGLDFEFYNPNGIHIREIDEEVAELMKKANFKDIRLSLETANKELQKKIGYKANNSQFINAVNLLKKVGFSKEINVYLLVGLPHQKFNDVKMSIEFAKNFNVKLRLAEFSPIPHTILWQEAIKTAKYDIVNEPLFHNNTLLPVADKSINFETLNELKIFARA